MTYQKPSLGNFMFEIPFKVEYIRIIRPHHSGWQFGLHFENVITVFLSTEGHCRANLRLSQSAAPLGYQVEH